MDAKVEKIAAHGVSRTPARTVQKSLKLANVCYDIRGPVLDHAKKMEEEGHKIIKLNIGNPATFGFDVPEDMVVDMIRNLPAAAGYGDSRGLFAARKAIMQYTQVKRIAGVQLDDIIIGNGVSELIVMAMQGLLNNGDEVLLPAPDYPLWTAAVTLAGGTPRHYLCDDDTYNANPLSMKLGLDSLAEIAAAGGRRIAILGGMADLGDDTPRHHEEIAAHARARVDVLVGVGELARHYQPDHWFESTRDCAERIDDLIGAGDCLLLKGSASVRLWDLVPKLREIAEKRAAAAA